MRGATIGRHLSASSCWNFNPRSSCEERLAVQRVDAVLHISIHAPHARSDPPETDVCCLPAISIHAPHARSDPPKKDLDEIREEFQSTLLMRGATASRLYAEPLQQDFNPRSSCEERQITCKTRCRNSVISIHAPHARSDLICDDIFVTLFYFNPRSSCEERPNHRKRIAVAIVISIHAPHARSDCIFICL